jgi:energy-coupling factor transporter ATP-binding protein EcfA2
MKIRRLRVENFKCLLNHDIEFQDFDLLIGPNMCGKSTVLQALSVFQFCLSATLVKRKNPDGNEGIRFENRGFGQDQFTAIPVSTPLDLWTDRLQMRNKEQVWIKIEVTFDNGGIVTMEIGLPHNRFSVHPTTTLTDLSELTGVSIVSVPSFAGLLVKEQYLTPAMRRDLIAKGRHGEVIRNALLDLKAKANEKFNELKAILSHELGAELKHVNFDEERDIFIDCRYDEKRRKTLDVSSAGSGFHQFLQIFAFMLLKPPSTVLLDEPDAHIHSALQKKLLSLLRQISQKEDIQVIIATHSKELINAVRPHSIISFSNGYPKRLHARYDVLEAVQNLGVLDNIDLANFKDCQKVIFVESPFDRKCVEAFVTKCGDKELLRRLQKGVVFIWLGGKDKPVLDILKTLQQLFETNNRVDALVIRDRDFLLDEDFDSYDSCPNDGGVTRHIWRKHEVENFLILPSVIIRLLEKQNLSTPLLIPREDELEKKIDQICDEMQKEEVFDGVSQEFATKDRKRDHKTNNELAREYLKTRWTVKSKLSFCSGKEILKRVRHYLRERGVTFAIEDLLTEINPDEFDSDINLFLDKLKPFLGVSSSQSASC